MQGEGIAFAKPGADEDFDEVGEWVVDDGAVPQESDGLGGCPAGQVRLGCAWQGRVAGGVVLQAALPDGVAEGADKVAIRRRIVVGPRPAVSCSSMKRATCRWLSFSRRMAPNAGTRSLLM